MPPVHWLLLCLRVIVIKPGFIHGHQSRQEIIWITPKKFQNLLRWLALLTFLIRAQTFSNPLRGELPHAQIKSSWMMDPTHSREMPSCSAIDLAKIRLSFKISLWISSIISGLVTVLDCPGRGASHLEKSPHLKWPLSFWRWHTMVHVPVMFLSQWREFPSVICLAGKKTWWQLASRCCWNRTRHVTCFHSASVTRKDLQFVTWTDPSFQDTVDSALRHRVVSRAKDLSASPHTI